MSICGYVVSLTNGICVMEVDSEPVWLCIEYCVSHATICVCCIDESFIQSQNFYKKVNEIITRFEIYCSPAMSSDLFT